jgi:outer membrane protein TolC
VKRILICVTLTAAVLCPAQSNPAPAAPAAPLTLNEAISLTLSKSKAAQLSRLRVETASAELQLSQRMGLPQIRAYGAITWLNDPIEVKVAQGSMTSLVNDASASLGLGGPIQQFPTQDVVLARGSRAPRMASLMLTQPLTQLWRIQSGVRAARAGVAEARGESAHVDAKLRFALEELFVGMQVEVRRAAEKRAALAWQERRLRDARNARENGELLDDAVLGLQATVIQARSELTRTQQDYARLSLQLADLIGRPGASDLVVEEELPRRDEQPVEYWTAEAVHNPERVVAAATAEKAAAGVRAARQAHIPEVSLVASGFTQSGTPLVEKNNAVAGVTLSWDVFDFGRRRADIARAVSQRRAAEVNRDRIQEEVTRQIRLAFQDLAYAGEQIDLARQAVSFRRRGAELAQQSAANGVALESAALEAEAHLRKAEADLTGALGQRHLALLRLYFLSGKL